MRSPSRNSAPSRCRILRIAYQCRACTALDTNSAGSALSRSETERKWTFNSGVRPNTHYGRDERELKDLRISSTGAPFVCPDCNAAGTRMWTSICTALFRIDAHDHTVRFARTNI